jgi:hypothetical protein
VTVECLDAGEDFAVVAAGNQDLCARADCGLEDGQGSGGELVLLDLSDLILAAQRLVVRIRLEGLGGFIRQFRPGLGEKLPVFS